MLERLYQADRAYVCAQAEMNAMFQGKLNSGLAIFTGAAILVALTLSACGKGNEGQQVYKGAMALENVRVGVPETVFKEAILTFVKDPNPAASAGGKTQYVGRQNSAKGGQYLAQCKKDRCYLVQVYYIQNPVSRVEAMDTLKQLLPNDAPEQSKVDDTAIKEKKLTEPNEVILFGDKYLGEFIYTDKDATKVKIVNAVCNEAMQNAFHSDASTPPKKDEAQASAEETKSN